MRCRAFAVAVALWSPACGKSPEARARDVRVCGDTANATRIAACLRDHGWDSLAAESAGAARAVQLDSIFRRQDDSLWHLDSARHAVELGRCVDRPGEVAECLRLAGWPPARATGSSDSLWNAHLDEHRQEIDRCIASSGRGNIADCLMLNYKWSAQRALATNDSLQLARARR